MSARTWIGLDTGLAAFGWAVMHRELGGDPTVLGMGAWKTKVDQKLGKLEDRALRMRSVMTNLAGLFEEWKPTEAYVESMAFGMNTSRPTMAGLGRVRGIVEAMCFDRNVELAEVRPDVVKQAVTGRRDADKETVARLLRRSYRLTTSEAFDLNATDALAVAHVGAHRHGHGVNISSGVVRYQAPSDDELGLD